MKLTAATILLKVALWVPCVLAAAPSAVSSVNPVAAWHIGLDSAAAGNYMRAEHYLQIAAKAGVYPARIGLCYLLESSSPPVRNEERAYAWCTVALFQIGPPSSMSFAKLVRFKAKKSLSSRQLAAAKLEAKELVRKYGANGPLSLERYP